MGPVFTFSFPGGGSHPCPSVSYTTGHKLLVVACYEFGKVMRRYSTSLRCCVSPSCGLVFNFALSSLKYSILTWSIRENENMFTACQRCRISASKRKSVIWAKVAIGEVLRGFGIVFEQFRDFQSRLPLISTCFMAWNVWWLWTHSVEMCAAAYGVQSSKYAFVFR